MGGHDYQEHPLRYIERMQQTTTDAFDALHDGIDRLTVTDFPDYTNVGDCAIALGQFAYWRQAGIRVDGTYSKDTITTEALRSANAVAIQGGGNLGGLYPAHDDHRDRLAREVAAGVPIIQLPQSAHFTDAGQAERFAAGLGRRPSTRIAVRDTHSIESMRDLGVDASLAPDAVHTLGQIAAPAAVQEVVVLLRRDKESARPGEGQAGKDWPARTIRDRIGTRLRSKGVLTLQPESFNLDAARWERVARRRFRRGVASLAQGEIIITDRLHAMLIGLQMGRTVIAVDNNVQKLQRYHDTWLKNAGPALKIVGSLSDAYEYTDMT